MKTFLVAAIVLFHVTQGQDTCFQCLGVIVKSIVKTAIEDCPFDCTEALISTVGGGEDYESCLICMIKSNAAVLEKCGLLCLSDIPDIRDIPGIDDIIGTTTPVPPPPRTPPPPPPPTEKLYTQQQYRQYTQQQYQQTLPQHSGSPRVNVVAASAKWLLVVIGLAGAA